MNANNDGGNQNNITTPVSLSNDGKNNLVSSIYGPWLFTKKMHIEIWRKVD